MATDSQPAELSAAARSLIDVAMEQDVPPADHVEGSWGMVVSRLTLEMSRAEAPPLPTAAPARAGFGTAAAVGVVVAVGALLWVTIRPEPSASSETVQLAADGRAAPTQPPAATPATPQAAATSSIAAPASHAQLLVDAEAALPNDPARALQLLDRHAELAPLADAERRMALRISTLCALGRNDEAKSQATAFFATARGSQWTARVRASCAG